MALDGRDAHGAEKAAEHGIMPTAHGMILPQSRWTCHFREGARRGIDVRTDARPARSADASEILAHVDADIRCMRCLPFLSRPPRRRAARRSTGLLSHDTSLRFFAGNKFLAITGRRVPSRRHIRRMPSALSCDAALRGSLPSTLQLISCALILHQGPRQRHESHAAAQQRPAMPSFSPFLPSAIPQQQPDISLPAAGRAGRFSSRGRADHFSPSRVISHDGSASARYFGCRLSTSIEMSLRAAGARAGFLADASHQLSFKACQKLAASIEAEARVIILIPRGCLHRIDRCHTTSRRHRTGR